MSFKQNCEISLVQNPHVAENVFIEKEPENHPLPTFEQERDRLPHPIWDGHGDEIACYWKAWELAFGNLGRPQPGSGFVSNFIDTAFNGCIFMWDSSFILMFGKYASRSFNFQGTLDNFYALQHKDGFICREIIEANGEDRFTRYDPAATGPDIMPWCEWEYFKNFGDMDRLAKVFPPLMAYHEWLRLNHTWPDGTYWSSGWGCGMDNLPRQQPGYVIMFSHGHMVWNDACLQELMNCNILMEMARLLGREDEVAGLREERDNLEKVINEKLWDEETAFYYDLWKNGELNMVKHIGAYWALMAEAVPEERVDRFVAHLENEKEFKCPHRIPALSADHPWFGKDGGYWNGGVWAPTNYMVLGGLDKYGKFALSHEIARNHLENVVQVYRKTGTVFENYAPFPGEDGTARPGNPAKGDFVGWTGLVPIAVLLEHVIGLKPNAEKNTISWHINLLERHGVEKYPFGKNATLTLLCEKRNSKDEEPRVTVQSTEPVTVEIIWDGGRRTIEAGK